MPNWVFNSMGVNGTSEELRKFVEQAGKPTPENYDEVLSGNYTGNSDKFSFWNFVTPPAEILDVYFGVAKQEKPEGYDKWSNKEQLAHDLKFQGNNSYDWNIREWDTKWDANDVEIYEAPDFSLPNASIGIQFSTAWSIPEKVFEAMVRQFPTLDFDIECEEEQGWGATFVSEAGSLITTASWDIPDSHADYEERGRDCWACESGDEDDLYDDCPRATKEFAVVVQTTIKVNAQSEEQAWELANAQHENGTDTLVWVVDANGTRIYPTLK